MDYLDKPPLLFWVNSFIFNVFGVHNWSFKLGSYLFTLLGVYSTFRLGSILYSPRTGRLAAILLYSCQAMFLINNDVRTDTILTGSTVFAIWQLLAWLNSRRWIFLLGSALGLALALLSKGPIGLMVPALAIGGYLVGKRRWKDFVRWEYMVLLALVLILISPMLIGLYQQYDSQPEKEVPMITPKGYVYETGVSGLKFYFWTQSFGRITGESTWSNDSGPFFFVGNFIWSFLPWSLTFILALVWQLRRIAINLKRGTNLPELLTTVGFVIPFIAFSLSAYKLPHYIYILFPIAAILTAHWWQQIYELPGAKYWRIASYTVQQITLVAITMVMMLVMFRFFPGQNWMLLISCLILILTASYLSSRGTEHFLPVVMSSVMVILAANLVMNTWFYPQLTQFQPGQRLVRAIDTYQIERSEVATYNFEDYSFDYYMGILKRNATSLKGIDKLTEERPKVYVITDESGFKEISETFQSRVLFEMGTHSVTRLNMKFLNHKTREQTLKPVYLLEVSDEQG